MLENITSRERLLGVATIAVALLALTYNFIVEPLIKQWNTLGEEIRKKKLLLTKHNRILRDKEIIEKLYSEYMKYFHAEKLTPEEESAIALSNIEKLARDANVHITNIKPLTTKSFGNYNKFTFRVTTESQISELAKFIYNLQSSDQLLKIERMVLRAKEHQPNTIKAILHVTKISVL
jgi:hypothetical protein